MTLKLLLQIGKLRAEDAKDHVTRLIDQGLNLQKENDLNNALANYRVANLLLKEFGAATEDSMRQLLRCLKCLENVSQAMKNEPEAKKYTRGVANLKKKLSKLNKAKKDAGQAAADDSASVVQSQLQPQNMPFNPSVLGDMDFEDGNLLAENVTLKRQLDEKD